MGTRARPPTSWHRALRRRARSCEHQSSRSRLLSTVVSTATWERLRLQGLSYTSPVRLLLAIAVLLGLAACERANREPDPVELPMPKVTVTLVDPGSEPRTPLQIHAKAGARATIRYTRVTDFELGSRRYVQHLTEVYADEIVEVAPDEIHSRMTTLAVSVDPAPRGRDMSEAIGAIEDHWRNARGLHLRPTLLRSRRQAPFSLRPEAMVPSPEQPVGVGARWHVEIEEGGSRASVDVVLLARDGDRFRERRDYQAEHRSAEEWVSVAGTTLLDASVSSMEVEMRGTNSLVLHRESGDVHGTETIESVPLGP